MEIVAGEDTLVVNNVCGIDSEREQRPARQLEVRGRVSEAEPVQHGGQEVCGTGHRSRPLSAP